MKKVADKLGVEARYVPYFVIGSFNTDGYKENTLITEIKKANENDNYEDIVASILKENKDLNPTYESIK